VSGDVVADLVPELDDASHPYVFNTSTRGESNLLRHWARHGLALLDNAKNKQLHGPVLVDLVELLTLVLQNVARVDFPRRLPVHGASSMGSRRAVEYLLTVP